MSRLAGTIDGVIGVDTHRDTLAAAASVPAGLLGERSQDGLDLGGQVDTLLGDHPGVALAVVVEPNGRARG
jgi:hypothetical protein